MTKQEFMNMIEQAYDVGYAAGRESVVPTQPVLPSLKCAGVAQSVGSVPCKDEVAGSSPATGSTFAAAQAAPDPAGTAPSSGTAEAGCKYGGYHIENNKPVPNDDIPKRLSSGISGGDHSCCQCGNEGELMFHMHNGWWCNKCLNVSIGEFQYFRGFRDGVREAKSA